MRIYPNLTIPYFIGAPLRSSVAFVCVHQDQTIFIVQVASKVHAPFLTLVSATLDGLASTAVYVRQVGRPLLLDVPEVRFACFESEEFISFGIFIAICAVGCVNGGCNNPGECFCNAGYSGALCNVANNVNLALTRGVSACFFNKVTSTCKVANGTLRYDCPSGYSVLDTVACNDVPGFVTNVCGRVCCDGWSGDDCSIRL